MYLLPSGPHFCFGDIIAKVVVISVKPEANGFKSGCSHFIRFTVCLANLSWRKYVKELFLNFRRHWSSTFKRKMGYTSWQPTNARDLPIITYLTIVKSRSSMAGRYFYKRSVLRQVTNHALQIWIAWGGTRLAKVWKAVNTRDDLHKQQMGDLVTGNAVQHVTKIVLRNDDQSHLSGQNDEFTSNVDAAILTAQNMVRWSLN